MSVYKAGSLPPSGYVARHEWAWVQIRAGLRQVKCPDGLWRFPQEIKALEKPE
jgi:hypothetical protein